MFFYNIIQFIAFDKKPVMPVFGIDNVHFRVFYPVIQHHMLARRKEDIAVHAYNRTTRGNAAESVGNPSPAASNVV